MLINNHVSVLNRYKQFSINGGKEAAKTESPGTEPRARSKDYGVMDSAISGRARARSRGLTETSKKAQESISLMQGTDIKLQNAESLLQRMHNLAAMSADGATPDAERIALNYGFTQYLFELCNLGSLRFDGVDAIEAEAPEAIDVLMDDNHWAEPETTTYSLGSIGNLGDAARALTAVDNAMDEVSSTRARLSEAQAALINELTSRNTSAGRLPETNRSILDADTAKRIAESIQTNMQQRPMTSIRAQANAAPQGVIQLLA